MQIRIEGRDLPGRRCTSNGGFPGYDNIHIGVQRRNHPGELLDLQPGDSASAAWTFEATVAAGPDGVDVRGPYIQGGPGRRFIYLSWGTVVPGSPFAMFRRAKLLLADVEPATLNAAAQSGHLVARLGLSDARGNPICARVRPPAVEWSAT